MAKPTANHLRIYREESLRAERAESIAIGSLPEIQRAFERLTGWSMRYVAGPQPTKPTGLTWSTPVTPGCGTPPGHLRLTPVGSGQAVAESPPADQVRAMASALAGMLTELLAAHHALWQREAELAAGVPVVAHSAETGHLALRLQSVLQGGAVAVDCQAAGLYLLDDATSSLKLRASWGMPRQKLSEPARPLQGALADLEAMLGHAVVLDDLDLKTRWNPPEDFPAAVCVPVCTPTMILGTLWMFSSQSRSFSDHETNLIEIIAGRLAADLEREMLLREGSDGAKLKRELSAVERMQRNQLPAIAPLIDGWDLAGWTAQAASVGGDFFDWFTLPDGLLAVALADVMEQSLPAAFVANSVKAAARAHGQYHRDAAALLGAVNTTLWTGSSGDQFAEMFYGLVETSGGRIRYSVAGRPSVLRISDQGWEPLSKIATRLGESPETAYFEDSCLLAPGESLAVFSDGFRDAKDASGRMLGESGLGEPLFRHRAAPAGTLVQIAREVLQRHQAPEGIDDRSILIIKRNG